MHGGASTGAPKGNKNALKHGNYTSERIAERRNTRKLIRECRSIIEAVNVD
jgi:glucans biosynthesis protein